MKKETQIYVYLLDEGTDVWRPVKAVHQSGDIYKIISLNHNHEDEKWEFLHGDLVRCKNRYFSNGETCLVAERIND